MEALSSSVFTPKFPETYSASSSIRAPNKRIGSLKISETPHFPGLRALALAREVPGGDGEEAGPLNNGSGLVSEESLSFSQVIHIIALCVYGLFVFKVLNFGFSHLLVLCLGAVKVKGNMKNGKFECYCFHRCLDVWLNMCGQCALLSY